MGDGEEKWVVGNQRERQTMRDCGLWETNWGFGGKGCGVLGEPGGVYYGGHVLHGALGVVHKQWILEHWKEIK